MDGTLYAWLNRQDGKWPNVNQALIWSDDLGATWHESPWRWPIGGGRFKPSTFLQFGRDYAGAPDDYVYFYGGNETGWGEGRHAYLGRANRSRMKVREAYEFFAGSDSRGRPRWSRDVKQRKPVFTDPAGVGGVQVISNAPTVAFGASKTATVGQHSAADETIRDNGPPTPSERSHRLPIQYKNSCRPPSVLSATRR